MLSKVAKDIIADLKNELQKEQQHPEYLRIRLENEHRKTIKYWKRAMEAEAKLAELQSRTGILRGFFQVQKKYCQRIYNLLF